MKRLFLFPLFLVLLSTGLAANVQASPTGSLVADNTAFALDLYAQLRGESGNLFFSPYSISTALAMTYAGARGNTETQMSRVLHFKKGDAQLHSSFGELQRQLNDAQKQGDIQLDIANVLWAQKDKSFLPAFLKIAQDDYQANVNQADFKTNAASATDEINRWVAQKTKDKIQGILASDSLNEYTRLVLVNAIYFKGSWANIFMKENTSVQPFHLSTNRQVDACLMHNTADFRYAGNDDLQIVELPYRGLELSMVILLPRQIGAFGQLEQKLSPAFLVSQIAQMKEQAVEIFLPKFKLASGFHLENTLTKMGMSDAFGGRADFSGLNGARDLYISAVLHKAWAEVNEEGTEAAADTTVAATATGLDENPPPPPPVFRADHPFVFLIRDTRSGSILFIGRLADPQQTEPVRGR
jgi:serpin B